MKLGSISAFFPAYNDEGTIKLMVDRLREVLSEVALDYEIIIVDDCSPDKSGEIGDEIAKKDKKVRVIHHEKNRGYGGALKSGFANSKNEWIFYTDGDAQYDARELKRLVPYAKKYDVVNGYKKDRGDGVIRKIVGKTYNRFLRFMFSLKVKDVDCDFRLIKKDVFDNIRLNANDGSICLEMMKKIQDKGYSIKNVPVNHYERVYGESQFFTPKRVIKTLLKQVKNWYDLVLIKNS